MTFTGDTQDFTAKVTSLRKVDWESLRPNFFFTGFHFVDLSSQICPNDACSPLVGNLYVYMDHDHLTKYYSQTLEDFFAKQTKGILEP